MAELIFRNYGVASCLAVILETRAGFIRAMRRHAIRLNIPFPPMHRPPVDERPDVT